MSSDIDFIPQIGVVYLNAEGKARSDEQLDVLIQTVVARHRQHWLCLAIVEADFLPDPSPSDLIHDGHRVLRRFVEGGRAQKLVINRRYKHAYLRATWKSRSFRADLFFGSPENGRYLSVVCSHLAHGEAWYESCDDYNTLIAAADRQAWIYCVGDYNTEMSFFFPVCR